VSIDLPTLLMRATSGKQLDKSRLFRPSWFYSMIDDPFWVWCEYHAPADERIDETTVFDQYLMQQGNIWEYLYVRGTFPDAYVVRANWGEESLRETLEAMLRGESAIHNAAMWLLGEDVYGKADLLVRSDDHPSDLGSFHYRVKEVKNAPKVKEYHKLQAAVYHKILSKLQGYCPESLDIVLREGDGESSVAYAEIAPQMQHHFAEWRAIRDGQQQLQPLAYESTGSPWRKYANRLIAERQDISLLPGIGPKTAPKLRTQGLQSWTDILSHGKDDCVANFGRDDHYYHALARQQNIPVFRPGEAASIRRRGRIVHFDVEDILMTVPSTVTRPHIYMLGVAEPDGSTQIWTARGEKDEARMWTDFLDWLGDPADVALYCWSDYEHSKFTQAANDHPQLADRLLAAKAALIDLKEEIKGRPFFPVKSYSIKEVAPVCGFHWSQADVDGMGAQLMYVDWLKTGDDSIIKKVEQYNREDVLAMLAVDQFVSALPEAG